MLLNPRDPGIKKEDLGSQVSWRKLRFGGNFGDWVSRFRRGFPGPGPKGVLGGWGDELLGDDNRKIFSVACPIDP